MALRSPKPRPARSTLTLRGPQSDSGVTQPAFVRSFGALRQPANDVSCNSSPVAASLCEACASIGADSPPIRRGPQGRGYSAN
jgi:hypothetical protein